MTAASVSFDGTRFSVVDDYTNWGNYGGSGAGGAAESPIAYQNALAANRKQSTTGGTLGGIDYDPGAGAIDMTGSTRRLWFCKVIISDSFDCNTSEGLRVTIGSAAANTRKYNLAGSTATLGAYSQYPAQGGYILTAIDPTIAAWPITTTGTIDNTIIDYFGVQGSWITGQAKAENIAMDAIDIGTGLTLTLGDGVSTEGNYTDFVAFDQDVTTNRWGVCRGAGDAVSAWGLLTIGSATVTEFLDTTSVVTFTDGYHSRGLVGVSVVLNNASTIVNDGALIIGEGTRNGVDANDTRPDYTVTGTTASSADFSHILRNFRDITYTSACTVNSADIEAHLLTQASAHISDTTVRTNALTNTACWVTPTLGTTSGLHDCDFIQSGAGHALEITATGTHNLESLTFTGYGGTAGSNLVASSGATDAAIYNNSGGAITLNINGTGTSPSIRNAAGSTTTVVSGAVTIKATAITGTGTAIQNARVLLRAADGTGAFPYLDSVTITNATTTATVSHTAHALATNDYVLIRSANEQEYNIVVQVTVTDVNTYTYTMTDDPGGNATGSPTSTFVALYGLTDANGELSTSRVYTTIQPLTGYARKSTSAPYYKEGSISGDVSTSTGFDKSAVMVLDQ